MKTIKLLRRSLRLSVLAAVLASPYLYYLFYYADVVTTLDVESASLLLIQQLGRVFVLLFISSYIGFRWGDKYGLQGLGSYQDLKRCLPRLVLSGLVIGLVIFILCDYNFISKVSFYYPDTILFALTVPIYAAFVEGLFTRFGLLTLLIRFFKNIHFANLFSAVLFAVSHITILSGAGLPYRLLNLMGIIPFFVYLGFSLLLGYIYIRFGLAASILVHFVASLRFLMAVFFR